MVIGKVLTNDRVSFKSWNHLPFFTLLQIPHITSHQIPPIPFLPSFYYFPTFAHFCSYYLSSLLQLLPSRTFLSFFLIQIHNFLMIFLSQVSSPSNLKTLSQEIVREIDKVTKLKNFSETPSYALRHFLNFLPGHIFFPLF